MKVAVVDYGCGNLRSVWKAAEAAARGEADVAVTGDPAVIAAADRVVFPGQGAMPDCMRHLRECGLEEPVRRALAEKPVLAICVGMQMLFDHSEEGDVDGLGIYRGRVLRFPAEAMKQQDGTRLKVPQMGWNRVYQRQRHPLFAGIEDGAWFYFVHSYFAAPEECPLIAASASYGLPFACAVARGNVFATQFHPEKSARCGLRLFSNFLSWDPARDNRD